MTDNCCPKCGSKAFKRNGFTRHGKQNHRCLECGRQFSLELLDEQRSEEIRLFQLNNGSESFQEFGKASSLS